MAVSLISSNVFADKDRGGGHAIIDENGNYISSDDYQDQIENFTQKNLCVNPTSADEKTLSGRVLISSIEEVKSLLKSFASKNPLLAANLEYQLNKKMSWVLCENALPLLSDHRFLNGAIKGNIKQLALQLKGGVVLMDSHLIDQMMKSSSEQAKDVLVSTVLHEALLSFVGLPTYEDSSNFRIKNEMAAINQYIRHGSTSDFKAFTFGKFILSLRLSPVSNVVYKLEYQVHYQENGVDKVLTRTISNPWRLIVSLDKQTFNAIYRDNKENYNMVNLLSGVKNVTDICFTKVDSHVTTIDPLLTNLYSYVPKYQNPIPISEGKVAYCHSDIIKDLN